MLRLWGLIFIVSTVLAGCSVPVLRDAHRASELNAKLGLAYMQKGMNEIALKKLKKAIVQNPNNATAFHYMAELYRRIERPRLAEQNYLQAIDMNPKDSSIPNNYGAFLCAQKQYKKAFKYFDIALENPVYHERGKVYENIGICSQLQGNIKIAYKNFLQAIKINPTLGKSLLALMQIDFDAQNIKSSYQFFNSYRKLVRHNAQSLWMGVLLETRQGNKSAARNYATMLKSRFPVAKETKLLFKLEESGRI